MTLVKRCSSTIKRHKGIALAKRKKKKTAVDHLHFRISEIAQISVLQPWALYFKFREGTDVVKSREVSKQNDR